MRSSARVARGAPAARIVLCGDADLLQSVPWLAEQFDVSVANGLETLLDTITATRADLVVVSSNGASTFRVLRDTKHKHPGAWVVLVTDPEERRAAEGRGEGVIDRVICRPLDRQELLRALNGSAREPAGSDGVPAPEEAEPIVIVAPSRGDDPPLERLLSECGFRVVVVEGADDALEYCDSYRELPLAVIDVENSDVDWLTLSLEIQARVACEILAVAPRNAGEELLEALRHRSSDLVLRPLNATELGWRVRRLLARWRERGRQEPRQPVRTALLGTRNEQMRRVLECLNQVAPTDATVLLRGATGTGKEVLAKALHEWSLRRSGPFFSINCGALHESLLDSELFGHERGAFTGAVKRKQGRIELAAGGTLFLDEIGELTPATQAKLLRVLQEREFMRVGGEEVLHCNVRIVAATHRDLELMTREGHFRSDLYYRLNVVQVQIPPLRERLEDLPDMASFLLRRLAREHRRPVPRLAPEALAALMRHRWPGNVREMENVLERGLLLCPGNEIRELDIRAEEGEKTEPPRDERLDTHRQQLERDYLIRLLVRHQGNVTAAAMAAGIGRRTMYRLLSSLQLDPRRFRGGRE